MSVARKLDDALDTSCTSRISKFDIDVEDGGKSVSDAIVGWKYEVDKRLGGIRSISAFIMYLSFTIITDSEDEESVREITLGHNNIDVEDNSQKYKNGFAPQSIVYSPKTNRATVIFG